MSESYYNGHMRVLDAENGVDEPDDLDGPIGTFPFQPGGSPHAMPHLHQWSDSDDSDAEEGPVAPDILWIDEDDDLVTEGQLHDYIDNLQTFEFGGLPDILKARFPKTLLDLEPFTDDQLVVILCGKCGILMTKEDAHDIARASRDERNPRCPYCRNDWWKGNAYDLEALSRLPVTGESATAEDSINALENPRSGTSSTANETPESLENNQSAPVNVSDAPYITNTASNVEDVGSIVELVTSDETDETNRAARGWTVNLSEIAKANLDWLNYRDKSPVADNNEPRRDEPSQGSQGDSSEGPITAHDLEEKPVTVTAARGQDEIDEKIDQIPAGMEKLVALRDAMNRLGELTEIGNSALRQTDQILQAREAPARQNVSDMYEALINKMRAELDELVFVMNLCTRYLDKLDGKNVP